MHKCVGSWAVVYVGEGGSEGRLYPASPGGIAFLEDKVEFENKQCFPPFAFIHI